MSVFLVPHDEHLPIVGPFEGEVAAVEFEKALPYLLIHGGQIRWAQTPNEYMEEREDDEES